jgi:hypothetical protein
MQVNALSGQQMGGDVSMQSYSMLTSVVMPVLLLTY